jgi:hypothetical protein
MINAIFQKPALYQGMTSVVPKRGSQDMGFNPCGFSHSCRGRSSSTLLCSNVYFGSANAT